MQSTVEEVEEKEKRKAIFMSMHFAAILALGRQSLDLNNDLDIVDDMPGFTADSMEQWIVYFGFIALKSGKVIPLAFSSVAQGVKKSEKESSHDQHESPRYQPTSARNLERRGHHIVFGFPW